MTSELSPFELLYNKLHNQITTDKNGNLVKKMQPEPKPMGDWSGVDILEAPSFQKIYVVVRRCGRKYLLRRLRRNKHGLYASEACWKDMPFEFLAGEIIMKDERGGIIRLRPQEKLKQMIEERIL